MKSLETLDIERFDVISFDIYDTLLKRDVYKPSRVFYYVESKMGREFYQNRREAERIARSKTEAEEITIEEIYEYIPGSLEWKNEALECELQIEENVCVPNQEVVDFLRRCKAMGKKIIIISDMYLSKATIEKILLNNNIIFDSLYVSSEIKRTKRTGTLYEFVKNHENIKYNKWLHVGDNKKSDHNQPVKKGIKAFLVQSCYDKNVYFAVNEKENHKDLTAFISNRLGMKGLKDNKYYFRIGYEGLGPLLWGFTRWLNKEIEKKSINKVFFLSRDGQIMETAYEMLNGKKTEHCYMYASRRSLIVPSLFLAPTLKDIRKNMFWSRYGTISAFLKKVGLQPQEYTSRLNELGLQLDKTYVYSDLFETEEFQYFYGSILDDVTSNSKDEYTALLNYLNDIQFKGKVALIDIGWHGNMQKSLLRIAKHAGLDVEMNGYYVGMNPENLHPNTMNGYIFDYKKNEESFYKERLFTCIFEMLFSADHGSVIKFVHNKQIVEMEEFEYGQDDPDYKKIISIQDGALQFIKDIENNYVIDYFIDELYGFERLAKIGLQPSKKDAVSFGSMKILRDEVTRMAEPRGMRYYLLHPEQIITDLKNSPWRIGFLKRLTGLNLPYYRIYYALRACLVSF